LVPCAGNHATVKRKKGCWLNTSVACPSTSAYECGCKPKLSARWPVWVPCSAFKKKCWVAVTVSAYNIFDPVNLPVCRGRTSQLPNVWHMGTWIWESFQGGNFKPGEEFCDFTQPSSRSPCGLEVSQGKDCEVLCAMLK